MARILVAKGRVTGVELSSGEVLLADQVVCNADPARTYGRLLGAEHCPAEVRKLAHTTYSLSAISLFCAVKQDLGGLGHDSGNDWRYRSTDVNGAYERAQRDLPRGDLETFFLAISSLKDPDPRPERRGVHTLEMFTFVPHGAFGGWADTTSRARAPDYDALKRSLTERMLDAAESIIPGLRKNLVFHSMGTPLTNDFYCRTYRGAAYGTAKTPW